MNRQLLFRLTELVWLMLPLRVMAHHSFTCELWTALKLNSFQVPKELPTPSSRLTANESGFSQGKSYESLRRSQSVVVRQSSSLMLRNLKGRVGVAEA